MTIAESQDHGVAPRIASSRNRRRAVSPQVPLRALFRRVQEPEKRTPRIASTPHFHVYPRESVWMRMEAVTDQADGERAIAVSRPNRRCHVNELFRYEGLEPAATTFFLGG